VMNSHANRLLTRLDSLEKGDGLQRAKSVGRVLFIVGLLLAIFIGIAVEDGLHLGLIAFASAALGWIVAERNALRSRISQWPIMRNYIDWHRVEQDLPRDL
jgi:hypothetical protein